MQVFRYPIGRIQIRVRICIISIRIRNTVSNKYARLSCPASPSFLPFPSNPSALSTHSLLLIWFQLIAVGTKVGAAACKQHFTGKTDGKVHPLPVYGGGNNAVCSSSRYNHTVARAARR